MKNLMLILAMLGFILPITANAESIKANSPILETDPRIINMGGYTAFMVNEHYLFTAKHCDEGPTITMKNGDRGVKVYSTNMEDGPIVYKMNGGPYKSFAIAPNVPTEGEFVWTAGYVQDNYQVQNAKIFGFNRQRELNKLNIRVTPGQSGSPVLNSKDEVVGIVQSVMSKIHDIRSLACSHGALVKAVQGIGGVGSPKNQGGYKYEMIVFGYKGCQYCEKLEREIDVKAYQGKGVRVRTIDIYKDPQADKYLQAFRKQTGFRGQMSYPTTWINGTSQYKVGYEKPSSLLGWVSNTIQGIVKGIINFFGLIIGGPEDRIVPLPPSPDDPDDKLPTPEISQVDWENVTIVIAARKVDGTSSSSTVKRLGLKAIEGLLHRANEEFLEGKATIHLADERTHAARYAAVTTAAGVVPDPVVVFVLVEKQPIGLKGLIASKVEHAIQSKFDGVAKADIIFERTHKTAFKAIKEAVVSTVTVPYDRDSSLKATLLAEAAEVARKHALEIAEKKLPDHADKLETINQTLSDIKNKEKETGEKKSLPAKVIAVILALFGVGYMGTGAKGFLANMALKKAMAKLDEVEVSPPKDEIKETVVEEASV